MNEWIIVLINWWKELVENGWTSDWLNEWIIGGMTDGRDKPSDRI